MAYLISHSRGVELRAFPQLGAEQSPVELCTAQAHEAVSSEEGLRGDEGGSREFCHDTKEAVHEPVNDSRAKALQAGVRDLEVRHEPAGAGLGGFLQTIDHCGKLITRKAIEEKMRRDQIVAFGGRIPCRRLGADEFHTIERHKSSKWSWRNGDL
jgi:hypothetical protein